MLCRRLLLLLDRTGFCGRRTDGSRLHRGRFSHSRGCSLSQQSVGCSITDRRAAQHRLGTAYGISGQLAEVGSSSLFGSSSLVGRLFRGFCSAIRCERRHRGLVAATPHHDDGQRHGCSGSKHGHTPHCEVVLSQFRTTHRQLASLHLGFHVAEQSLWRLRSIMLEAAA